MRRNEQDSRQRGIALIASLLMLLVMTLIGLSAMERTMTEEKMASNSQQKAMTFQAAETAIQQFLDGSNDVVYTNSINGEDTTISYHQDGDTISISASMEYIGETMVLGNSVGDVGYEFELTGVGSIAGTSASSTNVQGVLYIMPGS